MSVYNTNNVETMTSEPEIARTINLSDIYSGTGTLNLDSYLYLLNDEWIKIVGGEIRAESTSENAVYINKARKIILEDVKIVGGSKNGIYIGSGASDIRIVNCDISGWGKQGELKVISEEGEKTAVAYVDENGKAINYNAGIRLDGCSKITVEKCYIHEPTGDTTSWAGTENGITWEYSHPQGMCGIYAKTTQSVIRYNDIVGNEKHRFNDGIEGYGNFSTDGGFAKDCDIYGNFIAFGQDDGVELDGGAANVRFYNNRITNFYAGISTAGNMVGPSFVFNNVIHNLRDSTDYANYHMKNGGEGNGITNILFNTFVAEADRRDYGISSVGRYNGISRNNIIISGESWREAVSHPYADDDTFTSNLSFDYDLLGNHRTSNKAGTIEIASAKDKEEHALYGMPTFSNSNQGIYSLQNGSLGYDSALMIHGFAGRNMGAVDIDDSGLIPGRPLKITSDKYIINMDKYDDEILTISSNESDNVEITIQTNDTNGCIAAVLDNNTLETGSSKSITVTSSCECSQAHDEAIFVRFSNGLSVPILVRVK